MAKRLRPDFEFHYTHTDFRLSKMKDEEVLVPSKIPKIELEDLLKAEY
jgi:hypothetical protein